MRWWLVDKLLADLQEEKNSQLLSYFNNLPNLTVTSIYLRCLIIEEEHSEFRLIKVLRQWKCLNIINNLNTKNKIMLRDIAYHEEIKVRQLNINILQ